jgi:acyl-CoA dehydrogenase
VSAGQDRAPSAGQDRAPSAGQDSPPGAGDELRDLVADIAATHAEPPAGELPTCWPVLVELGLPLVGVEEARGGSGGSMTDLAVLVRALGRHAISTPLAESAVTNWVVASSRGAAGPGLRTITAGGPVGWARHADQIVLYRDGAAWLAETGGPGVAVEPGTNVAGEPCDDVRLPAAALTMLGSAPPAEEARARLGLLRAAALTGAVEGAYELTRGYVSTREQFGQPLVRIPAVAANLAIIKTSVIQCDAALARACGGTLAAAQTARIAHQLHGAIGVTSEYRLHLFTKRLWAWRDADTTEHDWSVLLGELAAAGGEEAFWDELTA